MNDDDPGRRSRAGGDDATCDRPALPPGSVWSVSQNCPHCKFSHLISLPDSPETGSVYIYTCPHVHKEIRFTVQALSVQPLPIGFAGMISARLEAPNMER